MLSSKTTFKRNRLVIIIVIGRYKSRTRRQIIEPEEFQSMIRLDLSIILEYIDQDQSWFNPSPDETQSLRIKCVRHQTGTRIQRPFWYFDGDLLTVIPGCRFLMTFVNYKFYCISILWTWKWTVERINSGRIDRVIKLYHKSRRSKNSLEPF